MDCQDYKEMISAHVDGALSSEERLAVRSHLDGCPKCTQIFRGSPQGVDALRVQPGGAAFCEKLKARGQDFDLIIAAILIVAKGERHHRHKEDEQEEQNIFKYDGEEKP